jgi:hypothetical protein
MLINAYCLITMMVRVTRNYTVRVSVEPGSVVIVRMRYRHFIIMFTAKVTVQGGYPYVKIPKTVREAYCIRPHDDVEILSISESNSAMRLPFSVSLTL